MSGKILNPVTNHYEFSGTIGVFLITFGLPIVMIGFQLLVSREYLIQGINLKIDLVKSQIYNIGWKQLSLDKNVWLAYLSWFSILAVFDVGLPGKKLKGIKLRDGTKLDYNINGLLFTSLFVVVVGIRYKITNGLLPELQFLYNNHLSFIIVSIIFSFILSTFIYLNSFIPLVKKNGFNTKERILSINGNTGNWFYDWFIGRELNPRFGSFDIKLFVELRPGLLLWLLINLSCLHHQYLSKGYVCNSLVLINVLEGFYAFDGVLNEEGVLSMMDITTDGFGFMLIFGSLSLVPFTYSLQSRYLVLNEVNLGPVNIVFILALFFAGYYIFHSSNKQKSDFRNGLLDDKHYKFIQTKTGSKLLCDGWWALSQHINYFGDWLIAWSWCLPTGFNTPLTYYYVIYFATLLLHRQVRDSAKCEAKYGETWRLYTSKVPYKIIPYVY
ncbi:delta(14)-sterol reductase [Ascoidea rubescens DSM 1968]|uniref:Delta(14)-sterol reductase n=1 Tax=Ascoidea rubescens DSM 1968 TaxID=1344418 RepID=A0A1D2VG36_9ASCO|nr:ERG4/ERG24 ergosterol biosynthesis protein [Ascoidea rubescens DSM 1968]ODV60480.1 ERG4/ERG24 ergosterol biosynthesis protein [Ascoidea rubescens DSM 1968]